MKRDYELEFAGIEVKIGKEIYVVPELNFFHIKTFGRKLANIGQIEFEERMDLMIDVIHAAVSRNYPEIERDFLYNKLSLTDANNCFNAILNGSGLGSAEGSTEVSGDDEEKK